MSEDAHATPSDPSIAALAAFLQRHTRLMVLGGAGCSTDSGIPDYRDEQGAWKRRPPVTWQNFRADAATRQRYWARSLIGWPRIAAARPGSAHQALARLEADGRIDTLVTQNVDGLHQAAGSERVIDLHGRLDRIVCTDCGALTPRARFQQQLSALNPAWTALSAETAPDGDADLDAVDFSGFVVPHCEICSAGLLKPDVVFFGESVPAPRVEAAMAALSRVDALLVVGSSLMVYSGLRFVRAAVDRGLPVVAVNRGLTRADAMFMLKVERGVGEALNQAWPARRAAAIDSAG